MRFGLTQPCLRSHIGNIILPSGAFFTRMAGLKVSDLSNLQRESSLQFTENTSTVLHVPLNDIYYIYPFKHLWPILRKRVERTEHLLTFQLLS